MAIFGGNYDGLKACSCLHSDTSALTVIYQYKPSTFTRGNRVMVIGGQCLTELGTETDKRCDPRLP